MNTSYTINKIVNFNFVKFKRTLLDEKLIRTNNQLIN